MKRHVMMRSVMVGAGLVLILGAQGCASKKWVRGQLAPVEQRVNNLEGQASSLDGRLTGLDGKVTSRAAVVDGQIMQNSNRIDAMTARVDGLNLKRETVGDLIEGVNFKVGSSDLSDDARSNLDAFVGTYKNMPDVQFLLVGHTDQQGASRLNFELGYRRAVSVAKHLITNIGIDPQRVRLRSQGKSGTLGAGETADRRVEVFAYKVIITTVR